MDYQYLHITPSDLSPEVSDLNARLALECLDPEYTHPHWVDAQWETEVAPHYELKSYADYLSRKAFLGKPLSSREDRLLRDLIEKASNKPGMARRREWSRRMKVRTNKRVVNALTKATPEKYFVAQRQWYRKKGIEMTWDKEGFVALFEEVIIPFRLVPNCSRQKGGWEKGVGLVPTWIGTIREALTPPSLGGMGLILSFARTDTSLPFGPGNTSVYEGFRNGTSPGRVLLTA